MHLAARQPSGGIPNEALDIVVNEIIRYIGRGKTVILCCPGSYRGEILNRIDRKLQERGITINAYVYSELMSRLKTNSLKLREYRKNAKPIPGSLVVPYGYQEAKELERLGVFINLPVRYARLLGKLKEDERIKYPEGYGYCWLLKNFGYNAAKILRFLEGYRDSVLKRLGKNLSREAVVEYLKHLFSAFMGQLTYSSQLATIFVNTIFQTFGGDQYYKKTVEVLLFLKKIGEKKLEDVECIVDALAAQWGIDTREMYELAKGTEERHVRELKKQIDRMKHTVDALRLCDACAVYVAPLELGIDIVEGQWTVRHISADVTRYIKLAEFVGTAKERGPEGERIYEIAELEKTWKRVIERKGVLVIKGPKGVGKSTLARLMLAKWLAERPGRLVIELKDALERPLEVRAEWIALFDPSPPTLYEGETRSLLYAERPGKTPVLLMNIDVVNAPIVIVLPNGLYHTLLADDMVKKSLKKVASRLYIVDVDFNRPDFLTQIVKTYSGCGDEVVEKVAGEISKFKEGYTLMAKLAGKWLGEQNCKDVKKAVEEAKVSIENRVNILIELKMPCPPICNNALQRLIRIYRGHAARSQGISAAAVRDLYYDASTKLHNTERN